MKSKLNALVHGFIFSFLVISQQLLSQNIILLGPNAVLPNSTGTYVADYNFNSNSSLFWTVQNGTILKQVTDPNADSIYCNVRWSTQSNGTISLFEEYEGKFAIKGVYINNSPNVVENIIQTPYNRTAIDCTPLTSPSCVYNLLQNINFTATNPFDPTDPFTSGSVPNWVSTHGSPQLTDPFNPTLQPPSPATGFAYMYASEPPINNFPYRGEGIAQKIPPLTTNANYSLSFFMRFAPWTSGGASSLDQFYIVLTNCSAINGFPANSYNIPNLPTNSQIVYQGTSISNQSWQQVQTNFTANSNYDMIWIFPKQLTSNAGVAFSYPVLSPPNPAPIITPNGEITRCVQYETGPWLTLTTNLTSNIQWYENGNLINGATSSTYSPTDCIGWPTCTSTITVKNTVTNCFSEPVQVTRKGFFSPQVYPSNNPLPPYETPTSYCVGQGGPIRQAPSNTGTPVTYWWEAYDQYGNPATGISISPMYTSSPSATITFPNYSYSTATIIAKAIDNSCNGAWDGSWVMDYTINVEQNCRTSLLVSAAKAEEKDISLSEVIKSTIYPNPSSKSVNIVSNSNIKQIQIYDGIGNLKINLYGPGKNSIEIDVSTLKPGFYICKLYTEKRLETTKFIVER